MSRRRRKHSKEGNDIDVTPLLNVMVVLVAFLLASVVYVHTAILQLKLPAGASSSNPDEIKKSIVLEVMIYQDRLEVSDRQTGPLKFIEKINGQHDFSTLGFYLRVIKNRFPDIKEATILLEKDTPYDLLIQTMDTVRAHYELQKGERVEYELFPDISIGDAPPNQRNAVPSTAAPVAGG